MAKKQIANLEQRIKNKQKIRKKRNLKRNLSRLTLRLSVLTNIILGLYIYDPKIYIKITNDIKNIVSEIAPILESLINQLPL